MYYVYDKKYDKLMTQDEWKDVIVDEDKEFYKYLRYAYSIKEILQMTSDDKENLKNNYLKNKDINNYFSKSDRWIKIENISMGAQIEIHKQYNKFIHNLMKS